MTDITYVTFGQVHVHRVNGKTFDKDCVAKVKGDRKTVEELFGLTFCFTYNEADWNEDYMEFYPRGYIDAN